MRGEIVGNAWSETGTNAIGKSYTVVERRGDNWAISGRKFYTTGSIFSDWTGLTASRGDGSVTAHVRTAKAGVVISDDRDGFGHDQPAPARLS